MWHSFFWHELVHCPHAVAATFGAQLLCKIRVQTKAFLSSYFVLCFDSPVLFLFTSGIGVNGVVIGRSLL